MIPNVFAEVSVAVSGLRGASTIDIGELSMARSSTHEEVTVAITNDSADRYSLTQVLSSPLVNESGFVLDAENIIMEISGHSSGDVRFSGAFSFPKSSQEIFTSNASGSAVSFTIIYGINVENLPKAGTYIGSITFTVQTVNGSAIDTVTVPIRLNVQPIASIEIAEESMSKITFGNLNPAQGSDVEVIALDLTSNTGQPLQLQQSVSTTLENEKGQSLPLTAVIMAMKSVDEPLEEKPLAPNVTVLTDETGTLTKRRVEMMYRAIIPDDQSAGNYQGFLQFTLTTAAGSDGTDSRNLRIPIEVEVLPILSLSIEPSVGQQLQLDFDRLSPGMTSPPQTLVIDVDTNTGEAYQVFQELGYQLISDEGRKLPEESFVCVAVGDTTGTLEAAQMIPVVIGKQPIYQSDSQGNSAEFSISYQVQVPENAAAGVYRSQLLFTVTSF